MIEFFNALGDMLANALILFKFSLFNDLIEVFDAK